MLLVTCYHICFIDSSKQGNAFWHLFLKSLKDSELNNQTQTTSLTTHCSSGSVDSLSRRHATRCRSPSRRRVISVTGVKATLQLQRAEQKMKESSQIVWDGQDLEDNHRCLIITSSVWVLLRRGTLSLTPQSIHHENKHISLPSYDSLPFHIDHECMPSVFLSAVPRPSSSLAATTVLSHIQLLTLLVMEAECGGDRVTLSFQRSRPD